MKHIAIPLVLAVALGSGCLHTNTKLPGVLDLRSDGSDAATVTTALEKPDAEITRTGFGAIMWGDGLQVTGDKLALQDRQWHAIGLIPVFNDQLEAEYKAMPQGTALRGVVIGDQLSLVDIALEIVPTVVFSALVITSPLNIVVAALPHMTINVSGTRIASSGGGGGGGAEPPPPTDSTAAPAGN